VSSVPRIDKREIRDHLELMLRSRLRVGAEERPGGLRAHLLPEWTAPATETGTLDLGVVMARVGARLLDLLVQRVNRIPELHKTAFLNLVGTERRTGNAARAPLVFVPSRGGEGNHVPAHTQVATTQTTTTPAVVFETERGFDLTAAALVRVFGVLPEEDMFADLGAAVFEPGAGAPVLARAATAQAVEHSLYFSHERFATRGASSLSVRLRLVVPGDPARRYVWERFDKKKNWSALHEGPLALDAPGECRIDIPSFSGSETSVVAGREARWLRVRTSDPVLPGASLPWIRELSVVVSPPAVELTPEEAFSNTRALDLNRDIHPFAEKPARNDAFYLRCEPVLAAADPSQTVEVTVFIRLAPSPVAPSATPFPDRGRGPSVTWEYYDGTSWAALTVNDGSFSFTKESPVEEREAITFTLPRNISPVIVNGSVGHWIRARLVGGDYGTEASSSVTVSGGTLNSYSYTPASFRPPFLSVAQLRLAARNLAGDPYTPPEACVSVNHFHAVDRQIQNSDPTQTFAPFVTLEELGYRGASLYLGFDRPFGERAIALFLDVAAPPSGFSSGEVASPLELAWEYSRALGDWQSLDAEDDTESLSSPGTVRFLARVDAAATPEFGQPHTWIRARVASGRPLLRRMLHGVYPNGTWARGEQSVHGETLGSGDGRPAQTLRFALRNVFEGEQVVVRENTRPSADEIGVLESEEEARALREGRDPLPVIQSEEADGVWVRWMPVATFRFSNARSRHYVIDRVSGEVTFGQLSFEPQFGALSLPIGRNNVIAEFYRSSGGRAGNREPGAIAQLVHALGFVSRVSNPLAATGGTDPESDAQALERGPATLKHRNRAVTSDDYDALARAASSEVALVHTLPVTNLLGQRELGVVTLVIVPESAERAPLPTPELLRTVETYLKRRAPETANHRVYVTGPRYVEIAVVATLVAMRPEESSLVVARALAALHKFLHPLRGGSGGAGPGFGSTVHISEIYALLEDVAGVDFVPSAVFDLPGHGTETPQIQPHFLACSGAHRIRAVTRESALGGTS
jgi:Baseplate J-like protein